MKKIFAYAISVGFVTFLSGQPRQFRDTQNNIGLCATLCSDEELVVDSDGWQLPAAAFIEKGYTPVRVQIKNISDQAVSISDGSIQYARPGIRKLNEFFEHPEIPRTLRRWVIRTIPSVVIGSFSCLYSILTNHMELNDPCIRIFLLCWAWQVINTFVIAPCDFITFQNLNKQLGGALRKALPTGLMIVQPGVSVEKIFLIPQDINHSLEFRVFGQHTDTAAATFCINIF